MTLSELKNHQPLQKVIVHSLEMALYNVSVMINNVEYYIPKPPQYTEFSVSQGLNIKALLCKNGNPF